MDDTIHPYASLIETGPGIHTMEGSWRRSPLKRRMTVMDVGSGRLAVHSGIRLRDHDAAALDRLGRVSLILVPNRFHGSEAAWYAERYRDAKVLVPAERLAVLERTMPRIDGTLERDWPIELARVLERECLGGLRQLAEAVFLHTPSRTLVVTDLVFNLDRNLTGLHGFLMQMNGIRGRFGPSRLLLLAFVRDRKALARSLDRVLAWDFDRVVMSHGRVLESEGKQRMQEAFAFLRRATD